LNTKAFPTLADNGHSQNQDGMDLRDYFAAKAMQAMIQNSALLKTTSDNQEPSFFESYDFEYAIVCGVNSEIDLGSDEHGTRYTWAQYYAEESYCIADAMMKAREIK